MYFVHRGDDYRDVAGHSFRDFMKGTLAGFEGQMPSMSDFEDHVTTAFPEVRLKQFLEMRGADSGPWSTICALPALWVGLLYDEVALAEAQDLVKKIGASDVMEGRLSVLRDGLRGQLGGMNVYDLAARVIDIASAGLRNRARHDDEGSDESGFLNPLRDTISDKQTPADRLLALYQNDWKGDLSRVFDTHQY